MGKIILRGTEEWKDKIRNFKRLLQNLHYSHTKGTPKSKEQKEKMSVARKNWIINNPEIALCNSCHSQLSYNRNHWIQHYQDVMASRGLV